MIVSRGYIAGISAKKFEKISDCRNLVCLKTKKKRPRRDLNPQSSDPKSDALSIRPRGQFREDNEFIALHSGESLNISIVNIYVC